MSPIESYKGAIVATLPETYCDEKLDLAATFDVYIAEATQRAKTLSKTASFYLANNQLEIYESFRRASFDEMRLVKEFAIQRDEALKAAIMADDFIQRKESRNA